MFLCVLAESFVSALMCPLSVLNDLVVSFPLFSATTTEPCMESLAQTWTILLLQKSNRTVNVVRAFCWHDFFMARRLAGYSWALEKGFLLRVNWLNLLIRNSIFRPGGTGYFSAREK